MADSPGPLTRLPRGLRLALTAIYTLIMVLVALVFGGVEWWIRLSAGVAAVALAIGIAVLVTRRSKPAAERPDREFQLVPHLVASFSATLTVGQAREWEGRFGLLVLVGVLGSLPVWAMVLWPEVRRGLRRREGSGPDQPAP